MMKVCGKKYIKIVIMVAIIFTSIFLVKNSTIFKSEQTIDYMSKSKVNTTEITGEIIKNSIIRQDMRHIYGNISSVELQFASFNNRINKGTIDIKISSGDKILAEKNYDVSKIKDNEFVKIPLNEALYFSDEDMCIEVYGNDCKDGSAVTLWMSEKDGITSNEAELTISGKESSKMLNVKLNYMTPKLNHLFWGMCVFILWIMIPFGIYKRIYRRYMYNENLKRLAQKYCWYFILFILAFILICFRDLNFLTSPIIYAEDGRYISNIFHNGFLQSIFTTRSGQSGDFQNSGSYLLLVIALNFTKVFHGYDLSYLPTYIGIISNCFFSVVAVITYIAVKPMGKITAIVAYLCIILIPVGKDGPEIFGRILNTVFIWPVFAAMLLIILYRQEYKKHFLNIVIALMCLLSCLSFPVTYGIVGMYLGFTFLRMVIERENKLQWLQRNMIFLITIIIGIYLLPSLLNSEGITSTMVMKKDSIIEFVIARHILYPFIYFAYKLFSDVLTMVIFILYLGIVLYALYLSIRKKKSVNSYLILLTFTIINWGASVGMRIKMTSLFDKYQSSFPDRYFYGCNILFSLVFIYAIKIIFEERNIRKQLTYTFETLIIAIMLINPYLFEMTKQDTIFLNGQYNGTFNQCVANSLKGQMVTDENKMVKIDSYPKGWEIHIPYIYARETANAVNK